MAVLSDYVSGSISLTNGSVDFTGAGTGWLLAGFKEGDTIIDITGATEFMGVVATIDANGAGTLTKAWEGPTLVDVAYRMRYQPDGARVSAQSRNLIEIMGNGNLQALAGLSGSANQVPMFTGPGAMTLVPKTDLVSGVAYDVQVDLLADRDAYDGQAEGFSVLVANVGDGRAAVYAKASATSGDWSDPAYVTGSAVTLDVTDVDEVAYGVPPDVTLTPIAGGYNLSFDIPRGMIIEPGTTTTLPPGTPAAVSFVPVTGGYRLDLSIPEGEGFSSEGDYSGATAYVKGDVVQRLGSSWIALQATTGNTPPTLPTTSNAFWQLLARQGVDGAGTVTSIVAGDGIAVDNTDPANPIVSSSGSGGFPDLTEAQAYSPAAAPDYMRLEGYASAGDGGGSLYKKVASEPSHTAKFSITLADAVTVAWYELSPEEHNIRQHGAHPDNSAAVNATAIQNAFDFSAATDYRDLLIPSGRYDVNATLTITRRMTLRGEGMGNSMLVYPTTFATTSDCLVVLVPVGLDVSEYQGHRYRDFGITPEDQTFGHRPTGARPGRYGFRFITTDDATNPTFYSNFEVDGLYIGMFDGYGLYLDGSVKSDSDNFFVCTLRRNFIWGGLYGVFIGDNVCIESNNITGADTAAGITFSGLGGARQVIVRDNNVTCAGGALALYNVQGLRIENNQFEHVTGGPPYGGSENAFFYLYECYNPIVAGNTISPNVGDVANTTPPDFAVLLAGVTENARFYDNEIATGDTHHFYQTTPVLLTEFSTSNIMAYGETTWAIHADNYANFKWVGAALPTQDTGVGNFIKIQTTAGVAATLPAGGVWAYFLFQGSSSTGTLNAQSEGGVATGGSTIGAASGGNFWTGFAWRVR